MGIEAQSILLLPAPRRLERFAGTSGAPVEQRIDPAVAPPQGYRLSIQPEACRLIGHDAAGIFYGRAWREQRRVPASAITHASVDAIWSFWF